MCQRIPKNQNSFATYSHDKALVTRKHRDEPTNEDDSADHECDLLASRREPDDLRGYSWARGSNMNHAAIRACSCGSLGIDDDPGTR
jgi:hypothetical protein